MNEKSSNFIDLDGLRRLTIPTNDNFEDMVVSDLRSFLENVRPATYNVV